MEIGKNKIVGASKRLKSMFLKLNSMIYLHQMIRPEHVHGTRWRRSLNQTINASSANIIYSMHYYPLKCTHKTTHENGVKKMWNKRAHIMISEPWAKMYLSEAITVCDTGNRDSDKNQNYNLIENCVSLSFFFDEPLRNTSKISTGNGRSRCRKKILCQESTSSSENSTTYANEIIFYVLSTVSRLFNAPHIFFLCLWTKTFHIKIEQKRATETERQKKEGKTS